MPILRSAMLESRVQRKLSARFGEGWAETYTPKVQRAALPLYASSYLKGNPGDLRGLAALLGHASLNTVMIYTEPTLDDLADRMQRVQNGAA